MNEPHFLTEQLENKQFEQQINMIVQVFIRTFILKRWYGVKSLQEVRNVDRVVKEGVSEVMALEPRPK